MTQQCKYFRNIVKGSFHQGNTSIFSANSVGKQCVPNCAIAALYTSMIPLYRWTSDTLDNILKCGDKLYNDIHCGNDFVQVHEIGKQITIHNNSYAFQIKDEYFGRIHNQCSLDTINMTLEKATSCLLQQYKKCQWIYCILCVGNQNGATASLLCLSKKNCYIFDPHSRNSCGKPVPNGTSVLMMFKTREKMISYLRNLYSVSKYATTIKSEDPIDIYSMCHVDFHIINTTVHNYFLDQDYFTFCSRPEKGKMDTKNSKTELLHNDYQEFVPQKKKRDRVKERRENDIDRKKQHRENLTHIMKQTTENIGKPKRQKKDEANKRDRVKERKGTDRMKQTRENIGRAKRKKKDEVNGKGKVLDNDYKQTFVSETVPPNGNGKVLDNDYQETFVSDNVPRKRKRHRVKQRTGNKRERMNQYRKNTRDIMNQTRENIGRPKRQKKDEVDGKGKLLDNDYEETCVSETIPANGNGKVLDNDYQETFVSDNVLRKEKEIE